MAANETIDKLKNAGYITVTADSQGIADKCQIRDGSSEIDEYLEEHDIQYEITGGNLYGVFDGDVYVVYNYKEGEEAEFKMDDKLPIKKVFTQNFVYFHVGDEFEFSGDKEDYKLTIIADYKGEDTCVDTINEYVTVPSEYFEVSPLE